MKSDSIAKCTVGVAWYRADQWIRLREVSVDGEMIEEEFLDWLENAENQLQEYERAGLPGQRVPVDVDELVKWCKDNGMVIDGNARSQFVSEKLSRQGMLGA